MLTFTIHGHSVTLDLPDPSDLVQQKILEARSFYELDLLEDMRARVRHGELAVDVGAHLGNHTVFLAKVCGLRVLAFEPQPEMYRLLVRNVELNGLGDQVRTFNLALGEVVGRGSMAQILDGNTGTAQLQLSDAGAVEVSTLDRHVGDAHVSLIKIDVEGFELEVLKGAETTLARDCPLIYAETAEPHHRKTLDRYLSPRGYVAGADFCSTPVVAFEHCTEDSQRFNALVGRLESAYDDLGDRIARQMRYDTKSVRQQISSLRSGTAGLDRRLANLERRSLGSRTDSAEGHDDIAKTLSQLANDTLANRVLLHELWNVGLQTHDQVSSGDDPGLVPLIPSAQELARWEPTRKTWTVPRGSEGDHVVQGFANPSAAPTGSTIQFHASANAPATFAIVRIFGFECPDAVQLSELSRSPVVAIPRHGIWSRDDSTPADSSKWRAIHALTIPDDWRPGCYVARFELFDGRATLHPFWVTSRTKTSPILRIAATLSHAAANAWGGPASHGHVRRLFRGQSDRQVRSLHRPYLGARGGTVLRSELPTFRWAQRHAVPLDCLTDVEVHTTPERLNDYAHVVIAGSCTHLTGTVRDALAKFSKNGGKLSVLGAAPGRREISVNLDRGEIVPVEHTAEQAKQWGRANADLWGATHFGELADPSPLAARAAAVDLLAGSDFEGTKTLGLALKGTTSGTALADDAAELVARCGTGDGSCDTILRPIEGGGRVFVAGSDSWPQAIDDTFSRAGVEPALDLITAKILEASVDGHIREPLVTVIMTAFNSATFVGPAIESILAQSYRALELIVIDDASHDDTFNVLLNYAAKDPRVRPFKSFRNHGTYWSKNFGMTVARGDLITFQDSDDTSLPNRIEAQVEVLRRNSLAMASMVDYERRDASGKLIMNRGAKQRRAFPSLMLRKNDVLPRIGYFDSVRTSADQEYIHRFRCVFGPDRIIEIREPLYQALVRTDSLTTGNDSVSMESMHGASQNAHLSVARREYVEKYRHWHALIGEGSSPYMEFPLSQRPFSVPRALDIEQGRKGAVPSRGAIVVDEAVAAKAVPGVKELWYFVNGAHHEPPHLGQEHVVHSPAPLQFTHIPVPGQPAKSAAERALHCIIGAERPDAATLRKSDRDYDIVMLSDFRFPGGTSQSNAAEIRAQHRAGFRTGLVQSDSPILKRDHPINPAVQKLVDEGAATFVPDVMVPRTQLLIIRHPTVLSKGADTLRPIDAKAVVVVVNQAHRDEGTGREFYDMAECQAASKQAYGTEGTWYPIGPLVRAAIQDLPGAAHIAERDWSNIIDTTDWKARTGGFVADTPVIGRHSRDTPDKWPDNPATLLAAYPADGSVRVRILGGADSAHAVLSEIPDTWEVLPFGGVAPAEFLRTIDFLVYFHHPTLVEAFGRTILEALAAGVPAIVPPHFRALFKDAAIYAEPEQVRDIVRDLYANPERYREVAERGTAFVDKHFSYAAHYRRIAELAPELSAGPAPAPQSLVPGDATSIDANSVYKFEIRLGKIRGEVVGTVKGVSRSTGATVFERVVDRSSTVISAFVVTGEHADSIDVLKEATEGNFEIATVKARRRADAPISQRIEFTDSSITAALATYPGRRRIVPDIIASLAPQVERLFVYLNNYDEIPKFITDSPHRDRITFILDPASELRAAAKFHWMDTVTGFHLICDDDIHYPRDYAARMVEAIESRDRAAIVGVHGVIFPPQIHDARDSRTAVFKFPEALAEHTDVHFLGTGTVGLHTSVLKDMDLSEFHAYPIANDEILAVSAKNAGVPMVCISRPKGWLTPHEDVKFGIFEERQINGGEHTKATELLSAANPWPTLVR